MNINNSDRRIQAELYKNHAQTAPPTAPTTQKPLQSIKIQGFIAPLSRLYV